jgi:uncharacterized protein YndB with AHSA1/START domain
VVLTRRFACTPEALFDRWIDPASLRLFLCPFDTVLGRVEVDAAVGGAFHLDMIVGDRTIPHHGRYQVIDRPHRLVFTWISPHTEGDSQVTLDFVAQGTATEMTLRHERLPAAMRPQHQRGWSNILDKLGALTVAAEAVA